MNQNLKTKRNLHLRLNPLMRNRKWSEQPNYETTGSTGFLYFLHLTETTSASRNVGVSDNIMNPVLCPTLPAH